MAEPQKFFERGPEVTAFQHDGTEETAHDLVRWIDPPLKASVTTAGAFIQDPNNTYIQVFGYIGVAYIGPGDWVIKDIDGNQSILSNMEFRLKHVE
jgi:hypothetical protein